MSKYSTKSSSLLQDNSWIKRDVDEDEDIDRDPNFGKAVLSRSQYRSTEKLEGSEPDKVNSTKTSTSVEALTKRFSSSQDDLSNSTTTTTTTVTKDGTTETITTRSTVIGSPTQTFTERVKSSSKGTKYSTYTPPRTTKVTETTVSTKDSEDKYNTLDDLSLIDSSSDGFVTTTTTTRTSSVVEDELYDTLLPKSITSSPVSTSIKKREVVSVESGRGESPTLIGSSSPSFSSRTSSDEYKSERKSYSYSKPDTSYEYSGTSSPSTYRKSYSSSRSDGILSESPFSRSSTKSVYVSSERTLLEKDLCSYCRKPFTGDAKMVLDDMKINCHATCLKCEVCNSTLGHMKAGDSLWVYKRMVHCENCFGVTREKWRR
ncbi:sciellin isoform X2 [Sparus aurata]|uniref:sciellin isoform X2 n=1 Tax=Sparus aurata TaxID=8175 RepID=UPI0011C163EE|nr:sciellin isoform X2 [Sparus aurata]